MHLCRLYLHVISLLAICPLLLLASVSTPFKSRVTAKDESNILENKGTQKHDVKSDADAGKFTPSVSHGDTPSSLGTTIWPSLTPTQYLRRETVTKDAPRKSGNPAVENLSPQDVPVGSATEHKEKELLSSSFLRHENLKGNDETGNEEKNNEESEDEADQSRSCPTCGKEDSTEEEAKLLRIEMFKQTLIKELHLDPNDLHTSKSGKTSSSDMHIPKLPPLSTDYMQQDAPAYDNVNAETLEIAIPGTYMGRECIGRHATGCATFDLRDQIKQDVAGAELWLYKMEDRNDMAGQTLDVYELNVTSREPSRIKSLVSRRESFVREGWLNTDLTGTVKQWLEEGNDNPVLAFSCTTCKTRSYKALYGIKSDYKPVLVVKFARKTLKRDKRSEPECDATRPCCKSDLVINFFDIGMTKILEPVSVNIGYCHGTCAGRGQYFNNHTAIVQHIRADYPNTYGHLTTCCVPRGQLGDLIILELKARAMVTTYLHGVIVRDCGCA